MPLKPTSHSEIIKRAVEHNNAVDVDRRKWRLVQDRIGTQVDGLPGPDTARALLDWQDAMRLTAQPGCLTPDTLSMIERRGVSAYCASLEHLELGCYLDVMHVHSPQAITSRLERLRAIGARHVVAILVDSSGDLQWSTASIAHLSRECTRLGVSLAVSAWWSCSRQDLQRQEEHVANLLQASTPDCLDAIEGDIEGQYGDSHVKGFSDLRAAAGVIHGVQTRLATRFSMANGYTSHPWHHEVVGKQTLIQRGDYFSNQAFSIASRRGESHDPDSRKWGPGLKQRWALDQAARVNPNLDRVVLAAWAKSWPDLTPGKGLRRELGVCAVRGIERVYFWSEKWLLRNQTVASALQELMEVS